MKKVDAVNYFGSKVKLAKALGITKGAVNLWGDDVPMGRACQIELITKGKLKAKDIRPMKKAS